MEAVNMGVCWVGYVKLPLTELLEEGTLLPPPRKKPMALYGQQGPEMHPCKCHKIGFLSGLQPPMSVHYS